MSGLGALAANYTDSEDEADESGNEEGGREKGSPEPAPHSAGGLLGSLKHLGSPSSGETGSVHNLICTQRICQFFNCFSLRTEKTEKATIHLSFFLTGNLERQD